ncbi:MULTISPECIES: peptidylprolyl isomerase [unclassified Halomonas]|uniref:peptidylprolyl isomerase n=1 Tax=unclassified Halomonas TaxID=2609666 RepID=UPI0007F0B9F1|nr:MULTISPECIES: peptidylprolyl isomerase [unclassified Halomonas]SBR51599.1 peptidyl-prolyl cis-trans isomerase C [Halomonas sp. HL-93]SNY97427.1 peptidyl-prolyl cis-trans isomerase C [Halomonas sp. hl-4]
MQMIDIEQLPGAEASTPISVGGQDIAESDIASEMQYHPADSAGSAQVKAARALVVKELLRQRAEMLGLIDQGGDADDQVIAELLEKELVVPEPTDADCERFYALHPERFCEPTQLNVRHVLLAAAPDDAQARDAQYHQGVSLLDTLKQHPERFTECAMRYSACTSNEQGGELGWLLPGQTVAELDRALKHLPEGLHERPIASRYGWHLVMVDKRQEGQPLPYADVADQVRLSLYEQATRRGLRHYLLALESDIGVTGIAMDEETGNALMQ